MVAVQRRISVCGAFLTKFFDNGDGSAVGKFFGNGVVISVDSGRAVGDIRLPLVVYDRTEERERKQEYKHNQADDGQFRAEKSAQNHSCRADFFIVYFLCRFRRRL